MKKYLPLLLATSLLGFAAWADPGELDNEKATVNHSERAKDLPPTIVLKVDANTQAVEMASSPIASDKITSEQAASLKFAAVAPNQMTSVKDISGSELDRDNGRESWRFGWGRPWVGAAFYGAAFGAAWYGAALGYYPTIGYYGAYYPYTPVATYYVGPSLYYTYRPVGYWHVFRR